MTPGIDLDSWYRIRILVQTLIHGIHMELLFKHGPMVQTWNYGIGKDSWYGQRLMVLTTPRVLTYTHGIVSVLLNHTRTRGPSVTRMRDFLLYIMLFKCFTLILLVSVIIIVCSSLFSFINSQKIGLAAASMILCAQYSYYLHTQRSQQQFFLDVITRN